MAAVVGVSFRVARKEIVGLLGPDGAGTPTTINMLPGVLEPAVGSGTPGSVDLARRRASLSGA